MKIPDSLSHIGYIFSDAPRGTEAIIRYCAALAHREATYQGGKIIGEFVKAEILKAFDLPGLD